MSDAIRVEVQALVEAFAFDAIGLEQFLNGPVERDLIRRAIRVESSAKNYATGNNGGPHVRTGRLRGSITWRPGRSFLGPFVDVGTAVFYGPFLELGTRYMQPYPFLRPALEAAREP